MMDVRLAKGTLTMSTFERSWEDLGRGGDTPHNPITIFLILFLTADVNASGGVSLVAFSTRLIELLVVLPFV